VTFALPYVPTDAELDPTCAPGDTDCYVLLGTFTLPSLTTGSVLFSDGTTIAQDNTNFFWDDSLNKLTTKYSKTDSVELQNSSFITAVNQTASSNLSVFIGRNFGAGSAAQTATSNPSSGISDFGGVAIGQNILSATTNFTAFTQSILIGSSILSGINQSDGSLVVALGTNIGGTGHQNQGVFIGQDVLAGSTAAYGYNGSSGHKNVSIGRQSMYRVNGGQNTALGVLALAKLTTGYMNTAIGIGAGNGSATAVQTGLTGYSLTLLGAGANWTVDGISNATAVGAGASLAQSNTVILGNNSDVGIGTSTPTAKFSITGNGTTTGRAFVLKNSGGTDTALITDDGTIMNSGTYRSSSATMEFWPTNNNSSLIFDTTDESFMLSTVGGSPIFKLGTNEAAGQLALYAGGVEGLRIDAAGKVGVGMTPSGTYPLEVLGQFMVTKPTGNNFVNVNTGDNSEAGVKFLNGGVTSWEIIKDTGSSNLSIWSSSVQALTVEQAGNVGIGDVTPDGLFDIDSSATTGVNFGLTNTGVYTGTGLFSIVANSATSGTVAKMTANGLSSGTLLDLSSTSTAAAGNTQKLLNVSLSGANSTASQVTYGGYFSNTHTGGSPGAVNFALYATASGNLQNAALGLDGDIWSDAAVFTISSHHAGGTNGTVDINSDSTSIGTNSVNWLVGGNTIDTNITTVTSGYNVTILPKGAGKLGVGDPTPDYFFDIDTDVASYAAGIFNDGNATTRSGLFIQAGLDNNASAGPSTLVGFADGDGTAIGSITFGSSVVAYNTTSDQRLKENIVNTQLTLNALMDIKIRDYTWIADSEHKISHGVIAQELYQVYPAAVTKPVDESNDYWMVDYSKLTPLIIKSIQDLKLDIDIKLTELSNLDTTLANSFGFRVKSLLANAGNGIEKIFTNEIETKKICIADDSGNKTCLTKSELDAVLLQANVNSSQNNNQTPSPEPAPVPDPTLETPVESPAPEEGI
jgi:hypothetical protein